MLLLSPLLRPFSAKPADHTKYPFGSTMRSMQAIPDEQDKWKYQSKERDLETGYDYFEARLYDSMLGRFLQVDPLSEKRLYINPYQGMGNNPISRTDPTGMLDIINPRRMVLSNKHMVAKLNQLNNLIAENTGMKSYEFQITLTGGDRYKQETTKIVGSKNSDKSGIESGQGNSKFIEAVTDVKHISSSNGKEVKDSHPQSSHLQSNGARSVDIKISKNLSYKDIKKAADKLGLLITSEKAYKDGHIHLGLPKGNKNNDNSLGDKNVPDWTKKNKEQKKKDIDQDKSLHNH